MDKQGNTLIAVFATRREAEDVSRRVRAAGASESSVRLADPRDEVASMQGEMRDEMENSFVSPQAALALDKEGARSMAVLLPIATLAGALLFAPLAFVDFGLSFAGRLLIVAACGAVAGATFGFVMAGGLGAKGSSPRLASEEGVTLRIVDPNASVEEIVRSAGAIRVDRFDADGMPTSATVSGDVEGVADTLKAGVLDLREGAAEVEESPQDAEAPTARGARGR